MKTLFEFTDPLSQDGLHVETDATGRIALTLELDGAAPRTLVLTDLRMVRRLAQALLSASITASSTRSVPYTVTTDGGPRHE